MQNLVVTQHPWLGPSVVVAALGLLVQGIKAGWDLVLSIKASHGSQHSLKLQEIGALLNLISGLPIPEARKTVWKATVLKQLHEKGSISDIYGTVDKLLGEIRAES
jgi:hypothetical protein